MPPNPKKPTKPEPCENCLGYGRVGNNVVCQLCKGIGVKGGLKPKKPLKTKGNK